MIRKILIAAMTSVGYSAYAQTPNSFPTSGAVGIGTTSPTSGSNLSVTGVMDFLTTTNSADNYVFQTQRTDGTAKTAFSSNAAGQFLFQTGEGTLNDFSSLTTSLFIARKGNIGIGTTSLNKQFPLDVQTNSNGTTALSFTNSSTGSLVRTRLIFNNGTTTYGLINLNGASYSTDPNSLSISAPFAGGALTLSTASAERIRISSDGKIGLETSNPTSNFHLEGSNTFVRSQIANLSETDGTAATLLLKSVTQTGFETYKYYAANTLNPNGVGINNYDNGPLFLATSNAPRLFIKGTGEIGIGTATPREALSVNGNIRSKQLKVEIANWPDFVFNSDYLLPSLSEIKQYIF